ncbi:MAG: hypothetical protein EP340_01960 [Alphaproteobacteria bacterium]|nr:MAG: hypothetical protein EP340_01960 [Alphaproteobacteria bacterium]
MSDNQILQGDSLEIMKSMETSSIDCVIVDPPYAGFNLGRGPRQYWASFKPFFDEMVRVAKDPKRICLSQPQGRQEIFKAQMQSPQSVVLRDAFIDKRGRDAFFLLQNPLTSEVADEENWPSDIVPKTIHPNERSINQMAVLVKMMSRPGELVFDPFCGSGAIGVAAVLLGRRHLGIELMEDRADDARARLEAAEQAAKARG